MLDVPESLVQAQRRLVDSTIKVSATACMGARTRGVLFSLAGLASRQSMDWQSLVNETMAVGFSALRKAWKFEPSPLSLPGHGAEGEDPRFDDSSATPPPPPLLLSEGRALPELGACLAAWPWLLRAPRGDGHPVIVLPGILMHDGHTRLLRAYLRRLGYVVHGWHAGVNLGSWQVIDERIERFVEDVREQHGCNPSLVGWSMGGLFARRLAQKHPERIRCVVTLATGIRGHLKSSNVWPLYEFLSDHPLECMLGEHRFIKPPPVPCTAVYSRSDGMNHWTSCIQPETSLSENVEIASSHHGMGHHPAAMFLVADRLARPEGRWQPFEPPPWLWPLYPGIGLTRRTYR